MFGNSAPFDRGYDEGIVTQVDLRNKLCKVKTTMGKSLDSVQWMSPSGGSSRFGDRSGPLIGDRAIVFSGLGYPLILGYLPKIQNGDVAFPEHVQGGAPTTDTGDFSPLGGEATAVDANSSGDMAVGDRIFTSTGGAMVAILRAGTSILRGSFLAQVIVSKVGDIVKVISKNFEHFSDVGSVVLRNFRGRVFGFEGYSNDYLGSRLSRYPYRRYVGDVAAAEALKEEWVSPPSNIPVKSDVLFKEQVYSYDSSKEVMHRTLKENGEEETKVTGDDSFSVYRLSSDTVYLSYNDDHFVKIDANKITLSHKDGAITVMDASGIKSTFKSGIVTMSEASIKAEFEDSSVEISSSSVVSTKGGTTITATDSEASMESGGHFCKVGASGVQLG